MPQNSQCLWSYLQETRKKRVTPGTFLSAVLRGKAKNYSGRYVTALINSLKRTGAKPVPSIRGGVAYILDEE